MTPDAILQLVDDDLRRDFEGHLLIDLLDEHNVQTVCDVACGWGHHLNMLQDVFTCTGVDMDEDSLSHCRDILRDDVVLHQSNWLELAAEQTYDAVICLGNSLPLLNNLQHIKMVVSTFARMTEKVLIIEIRAYDTLAMACDGHYTVDEANLPWVQPDELHLHPISPTQLNIQYVVYGHGTFVLEYYTLSAEALKRMLSADFEHVDVITNYGHAGTAVSYLLVATGKR